MKRVITTVAVIILAIALMYAASFMPPMGNPDNPTARHVIPRYLEQGVEEAGAENIITGIILNYRGYDTNGEVTVIFAALLAVLAVLSREKRSYPAHTFTPAIKPSPAIVTTVRFMVPFIILFSIYTILHGDISPGGGFQGGAIIGGSLIAFTTVFGLDEALRRIPRRFRVLLEGSAVVMFIFVGLLGIALGANYLTFMLPGVPVNVQPVLRLIMLLFIEIGIGVGGAMIFTSILFALLKEEQRDSG